MNSRLRLCLVIGLLLTVPAIAEERGPRKLVIELIDQSGVPAEGVRVLRNLYTDEPGFERKVEYITDQKGLAEMPLPQSMRILRLWFNKDGFAPLFANWRNESTGNIPERLTITLPQATTIGGVITDQEGNPIANASVEVRRTSGGRAVCDDPNVGYSTTLARGDDAVRSDRQGRWSFNSVPPGDDVELLLKISHDQFIQDRYWGELQAASGVTTKQLRERTARIVMPQGVVLEGRLVDVQGHPIAGAVVSWSKDERWGGDPQVETDARGIYRLPPQQPGHWHLAFAARNHQPALIDVELSSTSKKLETTLRPGKQLRLQVVDMNDVPLSGASVKVEGWKDIESFITGGQCDLFDTCGIESTNDEGRATWESAPDDIVRLLIQKKGFSSEQVELIASESEYSIALHDSVRLKGRLVDATSGETVLGAQLVPVTHYVQRPDDPIVQRSQIRPVEGKFEYVESFWEDGIDLVLQFEAPGYRPQRIGPFDKTAGSIETEVQMQPVPMLRGQVVDADGAPVAGATVSFTTKDTSLIVNDWTYQRDGLSTQTDDEGTFDLNPTLNPPVVIATHQKGYAEVSLDMDQQPGTLALEAWARVEGTLVRNGSPVVGERIYLSPIRMLGGDNPHVQDSFSSVTDGEGRFVFQRVPPVPSTLYPYVSVWRETTLTSGKHVPLDLRPGETQELHLGTGAVIRGRVQPSGELASHLDLRYCLNYLLKRSPGITPPEPIQRAGFDWQNGWSFDYRNSQEGRGFLATLTHHFVKFQSDGSFEIHGVEPGDYQFAISIYEPPEGCLIDPVGLDVVDVSVGSDDVELGDIEVDVQLGPRVGDPFPNFRFEKRRDGESGSVSDFQGRYMLIDFWATWCAPCVKQIPDLRSAVNGWDAERVTVLSVSLDEKPDHARKFILERNMTWPQALLAGRDGPMVRQQLGISSVPVHYVLDKNGIVLHRAFALDEAIAFVNELLDE